MYYSIHHYKLYPQAQIHKPLKATAADFNPYSCCDFFFLTATSDILPRSAEAFHLTP